MKDIMRGRIARGPQGSGLFFPPKIRREERKMPTSEDFRRELFQIMANAQNSGRESIEISARELHARVRRQTHGREFCILDPQASQCFSVVGVGRGSVLLNFFRLSCFSSVII